MSCRNKAFTLMELMVVVAIIALLVGLVIVSMRGVRASASRSESLGALRQMVLAHGQYTTEHRGRLMPGYMDQEVLQQLELSAKLEDGTELDWTVCNSSICDAGSYVWRMAPYLDHAWLTFFADMGRSPRSRFVDDFDNEVYGPADYPDAAFEYGIAARPSYGLNSIFVGGDSCRRSPPPVSRRSRTRPG
jgi:prepilin-type N-terminal cleavage/methylation domain-containing protein